MFLKSIFELLFFVYKFLNIHVHDEDGVLVAHHFHNVSIEAVIGGKGYDSTDDGKDAQETETLNLAQPHSRLTHLNSQKETCDLLSSQEEICDLVSAEKKHGLICRQPGEQTSYYLQTPASDASLISSHQICPLSYFQQFLRICLKYLIYHITPECYWEFNMYSGCSGLSFRAESM